MSIYTDCRTAAEMLMDDPTLRPVNSEPSICFTEMDVLFMAAREVGPRLNPSEMQGWWDAAPRECSNAMGALWRERTVVRFGPVIVNSQYAPDYARIASKIIYAEFGKVSEIETPNGTFPAISVDQDPGRTGRRAGANRNDLEPWSEQPHLLRDPVKGTTPEQREIRRLKLRVETLERQLAEASAREHAAREHSAGVIINETNNGTSALDQRRQARRKSAAS